MTYETFLSWAIWIQFLVLIPISLWSVQIMSSHLRLDLPRGLLPVVLQDKSLKELLPFFSILATCPIHIDLVDLITLTISGKRYKLWSCTQVNYTHKTVSNYKMMQKYTHIKKSFAVPWWTCGQYATTDTCMHQCKRTCYWVLEVLVCIAI